MAHTKLSGEEIAQEAMKIAASKCIYTSDKFVMEKIVWFKLILIPVTKFKTVNKK